MNEKFLSIKPEKRERIIKAALSEFARNGYERASTNEIIREADISKGALFNYFNSKKELYLYLIDYVLEIIQGIYDQVDWNETDLFRRLKAIGLVKFETYKRYPQVYDFLNSAAVEEAAEVKTEIETIKMNTLASGFEIGLNNLDWSKFRDDIDTQKAMDIIKWTILSFSDIQRKRVQSFTDTDSEVLDEWDAYFDIFRRCFYKKEEQ
jgi:TetR/AcrR family transcriptional regulator